VLAREVYNRNNYAKGDGLPFGGSIPPCLDPEASPLPLANEEICSAFSNDCSNYVEIISKWVQLMMFSYEPVLILQDPHMRFGMKEQ
jgi:hypothetical protein